MDKWTILSFGLSLQSLLRKTEQYDYTTSMIFFRVIKKTSEISSKNRNKIISFLQSQDGSALVKFNFTEGSWEEGVFSLGFSVWL